MSSSPSPERREPAPSPPPTAPTIPPNTPTSSPSARPPKATRLIASSWLRRSKIRKQADDLYHKLLTADVSLRERSPRLLRALSRQHGEALAARPQPATRLRLVAREHPAGIGGRTLRGQGPGRRIQHLQRQSSPGIQLVLRPRLHVDFARAQLHRRLRDHPHRARISDAVPAPRRQDSARNRPDREADRLVEGLSLRHRLRRRHAAFHRRIRRLRPRQRRRRLRARSLGQPVARLSVSEVHLRAQRPLEESACRARLDRRRSAALHSGPATGSFRGRTLGRVVPGRRRSGRSRSARQPRACHRQARRRADSRSGGTQQRATIEKLFWSPQTNSYGYALDSAGKLIDKPSVLGTVPMWFGELDQRKSDLFLNQMAGPCASGRLGHAHHLAAGPQLLAHRIPLRQCLAAVHRMGLRRRIPLPPPALRLCQPHGQRATRARRIAGPRDRSALRRLLHPAFHQHAAPDLVVGDGDQLRWCAACWASKSMR